MDAPSSTVTIEILDDDDDDVELEDDADEDEDAGDKQQQTRRSLLSRGVEIVCLCSGVLLIVSLKMTCKAICLCLGGTGNAEGGSETARADAAVAAPVINPASTIAALKDDGSVKAWGSSSMDGADRGITTTIAQDKACSLSAPVSISRVYGEEKERDRGDETDLREGDEAPPPLPPPLSLERPPVPPRRDKGAAQLIVYVAITDPRQRQREAEEWAGKWKENSELPPPLSPERPPVPPHKDKRVAKTTDPRQRQREVEEWLGKWKENSEELWKGKWKEEYAGGGMIRGLVSLPILLACNLLGRLGLSLRRPGKYLVLHLYQ